MCSSSKYYPDDSRVANFTAVLLQLGQQKHSQMIGEVHFLPFFFSPSAFEASLRPFLPFSIVPGTASPGKASSNGEDYSAAITEPECSL